jgi:hypothetical protein
VALARDHDVGHIPRLQADELVCALDLTDDLDVRLAADDRRDDVAQKARHVGQQHRDRRRSID